MRLREHPAKTLEKLYRGHPVREGPILMRLRASGKGLRGLTAIDLAEDRATDATDQNHIGGSRSVFALAGAVRLTRDDVVLDLGCGLGGSARLLADRFGCRVDGIDISRQRVREGNHLTALVGMDHVVHLKRGDMLRVRVPQASYDVLWGQSAWTHVANKSHFLNRWRQALRHGGRIALEDVYVKRLPVSAMERRLLAGLERDWYSTLISRAEWIQIFTGAGTTVTLRQDCTAALLKHFRRLDDLATRTAVKIPALERRAWRNAISAAECGLIGYLRMTAIVQPARLHGPVNTVFRSS